MFDTLEHLCVIEISPPVINSWNTNEAADGMWGSEWVPTIGCQRIKVWVKFLWGDCWDSPYVLSTLTQHLHNKIGKEGKCAPHGSRRLLYQQQLPRINSTCLDCGTGSVYFLSVPAQSPVGHAERRTIYHMDRQQLTHAGSQPWLLYKSVPPRVVQASLLGSPPVPLIKTGRSQSLAVPPSDPLNINTKLLLCLCFSPAAGVHPDGAGVKTQPKIQHLPQSAESPVIRIRSHKRGMQCNPSIRWLYSAVWLD